MNFMTRRAIEKQKLLDDIGLGVWIICNELPRLRRNFFDRASRCVSRTARCLGASRMIVSALTMIRILILTSAIAQTMEVAAKGCSGDRSVPFLPILLDH